MAQTYYRVFPTQANLMLFKQRLAISVKGLHFLKSKRDVLLLHHRELLKKQLEVSESIVNDFMAAILTINRAKFLDVNLFPLSIVGFETESVGRLVIRTKNVVGILIPSITYYNPYRYDHSLVGLSRGGKAILGIRLAFMQLLSTLVNISALLIADIQLRVGIEQTSIRTNALEYLVIPRTTATVDFIKAELDEMAREDFYRIKRMMGKKIEKAKRREKELLKDKAHLNDNDLHRELRARSTILAGTSNTISNFSSIAVNSSVWDEI